MKLLLWTAIAALLAGITTLLVAGLTWPAYDPADASAEATTAAEYAGAPAPNVLEYMTPPAGFDVGHQVALAAGSSLLAVGVLAALLALHARALLSGRS
jgi:Na+/H+-dicarboxylate symporter